MPQRAPCGSTCVGADTARVAASSLRCLCPIFLKHDGRKRKARSNHSMKPTRAATVDVRAEIDLRACGLSLIRSAFGADASRRCCTEGNKENEGGLGSLFPSLSSVDFGLRYTVEGPISLRVFRMFRG